MKRCVLVLSLLLVSLPVYAQVTEPNGLVVPLDSMNGEVQLYTLFSMRGEAVDWIADAHTTPAVFSPLCSFRATYLLNESAWHLGVGWYNDDATRTTPPTLAEIHVVIPAGSPVGTVVMSADIRTSPDYTGGLVGFALVGMQTHYSEQRWNPTCTGCSPPGPWAMAMIYHSTTIANAYYVAFEDGPVGANPTDFGNDGDYNDDVFLLEGITCSGGGAPCDTGMPGICALGVQQCTATGTTCSPAVTPTTETCNGLDDDCNGAVDDGSLCPTDFVCDRGTCVHRCGVGEFACDMSLVCDADGFCVDPACATVMCPAGSVCHAGLCRAPCDGVTCPYPLACRVDRCIDPCAGVTCGMGQVCDGGICKDPCTCAACSTGLACETASGLCRDPACIGMTCTTGTHCVGGACVDDCSGATCPPGSMCSGGACVPTPPAPDAGAPDGGTTLDAGPTLDGGIPRADGGGTHVTSGGCCSVAGARSSLGPLLVTSLVLLAVRRRRRRRTS